LAMRFKGRAIWTAGIVFTAAVAALDAAQLSRSRIPDLHRLYESGMERVRVPPVIIVPGILGSRLRERGSGRELWPGSLYNILISAKFVGPQNRSEDSRA